MPSLSWRCCCPCRRRPDAPTAPMRGGDAAERREVADLRAARRVEPATGRLAPGYAAPGPLLNFHDLTLGGVNLPALVLSQGYAFATTSYRQNGLAISRAPTISANSSRPSPSGSRPPQRTFMTGGSEGGLVAALLLEQSPGMFSSGLAACSPVGTFRGQVNYIGDFRVLFDYFFPEVIPGSAIDVPFYVVKDWVKRTFPRRYGVEGEPRARARADAHVRGRLRSGDSRHHRRDGGATCLRTTSSAQPMRRGNSAAIPTEIVSSCISDPRTIFV